VAVIPQPLATPIRELEGLSIALVGGHIAMIPVRTPGVVTASVSDETVIEQTGPVGEGPGELRSPHELWNDAGQLKVYDIATARTTSFTMRADTLVYVTMETGLPVSSSVAGGGGGITAFLTPGAVHYGLVSCRSASGTVPLPARLAPRKRGVPDVVSVTADSLVVVYDGTQGVFLVAHCDGRTAFGPFPIPEVLRAALVSTNDSLRRASGESQVEAGPSAKFMATDSEGGVLLFYYLAGRSGYGLHLNPRTGRMVRLGAVSDDSAYAGLQKAARGAVEGSALVTTRLGGTHRYKLEWRAPGRSDRSPDTMGKQ
jgi:hypothetical protein